MDGGIVGAEVAAAETRKIGKISVRHAAADRAPKGGWPVPVPAWEPLPSFWGTWGGTRFMHHGRRDGGGGTSQEYTYLGSSRLLACFVTNNLLSMCPVGLMADCGANHLEDRVKKRASVDQEPWATKQRTRGSWAQRRIFFDGNRRDRCFTFWALSSSFLLVWVFFEKKTRNIPVSLAPPKVATFRWLRPSFSLFLLSWRKMSTQHCNKHVRTRESSDK